MSKKVFQWILYALLSIFSVEVMVYFYQMPSRDYLDNIVRYAGIFIAFVVLVFQTCVHFEIGSKKADKVANLMEKSKSRIIVQSYIFGFLPFLKLNIVVE